MNSSFRILVVDDAPDVLNGTAHLLESAGYVVDRAATGERALAAIAAQPPDLLLLDRDLGSTDGLEICRRIKREPAYADTLVVIVSASYTASENQSEGLEAGADGYIARPIANRELLARVSAYLRILRLSRELRRQTSELAQKADSAVQAQLASLNLLEDAMSARQAAERANLKLQDEITTRGRAEAAIVQQLDELRRWQEVMLDREDRVQELKREVNELAARLGETVRYPSQATGSDK
jgi:DNA-binding response OmpR family regulator